MCARHGASIAPRLVDLGKLFPVSGGLPLAKRAPQRLAYRLVELARWRDALGVPINLQPKYMASGADLATRWILAALEGGVARGLALAGAIMRGRFAEERDIADAPTLAGIAKALGQDAAALAARAAAAEIADRYDAQSREAIDAGVFGVPWYVYRGTPYWGQDRLDFLTRELAK